MIPRDRELLAKLARFNGQVPKFVLAYLDGEISPDDQLALAEQLVGLADAVRQHAHDRLKVIDGEADSQRDGGVGALPLMLEASGDRHG